MMRNFKTKRPIASKQLFFFGLFSPIFFFYSPPAVFATERNHIDGTYGDWTSCGPVCSKEVAFEGLLVRTLPDSCVLTYFEARGEQKDYNMFASGRLEGDTLVAYEQVVFYDAGKFVSKSCKVIFKFHNNSVEFDGVNSDDSGYCTKAVAGSWLGDFQHSKSSGDVIIPPNAEKIYKNEWWRKHTQASAQSCSQNTLP